MNANIQQVDEMVAGLIEDEEKRQQNKLSMIPSENFASRAVREAQGSVLTNKYAEGYSGKRYYEGNQNVDEIENLAVRRIKELFNLPLNWHVNVQPLSGSNANLAVYNALLTPGDTILSMYLPDGGHLSHGWSFPEGGGASALEGQIDQAVYLGGARKVSIVSKIFNVVQYKVNPETRLFDYQQIMEIAKEHKPKMIISGGTAYPREIDYGSLAAIAKEVGALYMADIAHEAGLVAGGANHSPVGIADVVTFTTHKTLRGPRGAVIMCREELGEKIDFGVFPGMQGGPFQHNIAAMAVALKEALEPEFKTYAHQVVKNAKHLAAQLVEKGYDVVSGGTDKHLVLIDMRSKGMAGRNLAKAMDKAGIVLNRNSVPNETGSPMNPSGIRMGTPVLTTRGMKEPEMEQIAAWFDQVVGIAAPYANLKLAEFTERLQEMRELDKIAQEVKALCAKFPLAI